MDALTDRQSEILKLIRELTGVSGYPPTRAEIAERMGFRSVNAAEQHLRALERKGASDMAEGASRGLKAREARPPRRRVRRHQRRRVAPLRQSRPAHAAPGRRPSRRAQPDRRRGAPAGQL